MKALEAFAASDNETALRWTLAHLEQRTCTRTPAIVTALKDKRYADVAEILRFIVSTMP